MKDKLKWVATGGGPLIVVPVEIAHHWRGDEMIWPPTGNLETIWEAVRKSSDYDRACGVEGYLGVLAVGPGTCLILGDEPMQTAFIPATGGGLLVRWMYAEGEEEVLRAVESAPEAIWQPTPYRLRVGRGGLLLFDSVFPGDGLPSICGDGANVPWLKVPVSRGTYEVDTADYVPDEETHLILHRLRWGRSVSGTVKATTGEDKCHGP